MILRPTSKQASKRPPNRAIKQAEGCFACLLAYQQVWTGTIPRAMGLEKTAPTRLKICATSGFLGITTTWKIWMSMEGWVSSYADCPQVYQKLGNLGLPLLARFHLRWPLAKLIIRPYALSEDHEIPLDSLFLYLRREAWNNEIVALCIPPQKDQSLMPVCFFQSNISSFAITTFKDTLQLSTSKAAWNVLALCRWLHLRAVKSSASEHWKGLLGLIPGSSWCSKIC